MGNDSECNIPPCGRIENSFPSSFKACYGTTHAAITAAGSPDSICPGSLHIIRLEVSILTMAQFGIIMVFSKAAVAGRILTQALCLVCAGNLDPVRLRLGWEVGVRKLTWIGAYPAFVLSSDTSMILYS
jgi:hypothetical protein